MLKIIDYPPIRTPNYSRGRVLGDIESHVDKLPNQYQDKSLVTSAHEEQHFLSSSIRNKFPGQGGFYLLNNKAAILNNPPNITLNDVRKEVPANLHGISFSLYLINAQHDWNTFPLYIADELNSYILGSLCGLEIGEEFASEIQQAIEFSLYLSVLTELSKSDELLSFQQYQLKRALEIQSKKPSSGGSVYLQKWTQDSVYKKYLQTSLEGYGNSDFL